MREIPSPVEWTELAPQVFIQPQGGVGVAEAEAKEVAEYVGPEDEENALPGPIAMMP